jgi:hypothetical protein
VQEAIQLATQGIDDGGCAVASVKAADTPREVYQAIAVNVLDDCPFRLRDEYRSCLKYAQRHSRVATLHQRL